MNKYITPALIGLTLVSGMFLYSRTINFGTVQYEVVAAPSSTPSPLSTPSPQPTTSPSVAPSVTPTSAPAKPTSSPTPETPVNVGVEENSTNKEQDQTPAPKPKVVIPEPKGTSPNHMKGANDCTAAIPALGDRGPTLGTTYLQFKGYMDAYEADKTNPNICNFAQIKARIGSNWDNYIKAYLNEPKK